MRVGRLALGLSLLVPITLSCQPPVEEMVVSMEEDLAAIRTQVTALQNAIRAMEWNQAAQVLAEDVVVMVPNRTSILGRTDWLEWVETDWPITEVPQYDLGIEDLHVSGDFGYLRGTFAMSLSLEGVDEPYVDEGKNLQIWRKDSDGVWRVAVDSWSSDLPLATPEGLN
jgi:ketosteroid isomerase-like protein